MKNRHFFVGIAAVLVLFTACKNPFFPAKKGGANSAEVPVVTLNALPANPYILGDDVTITANAVVNDGGTLSYQWFRNTEDSNEGGELLPNETGASYAPSTDDEGTTYYYVRVTNTLNRASASAISGTAEITVYDIGEAAAIRSAALTVTAPVKDGLSVATATTDDNGYTCTAVSWSPTHNPFQGGVAYTVTVTLTAEENHTFIALRTAAINGQAAAVTANDGDTLTLSYTFAVTDTKTVTGIARLRLSQQSRLTPTAITLIWLGLR